MSSVRSSLAGLGLLAFLSTTWAGERPPAGSRPLSAILSSVEAREPGVVVEAEFDDGSWEITVCEAAACRVLYVDPASGDERRRRPADREALPPAGARPLSEIVRTIEDRRAGVVTEVELDDGLWEIELRRDGDRSEVRVDPVSGAVRE